MAEPPSFAGAVNSTEACALPVVAITPVGAPGAVATGVTELETPDGIEVPALFVAVTVNV
jgi:hypothetical protein